MVKAILFLGIFFFCNSSYSQKIQYSKGTFPIYNSYEAILVANVNGNHHLLTFVADKKPGIYVFNSELQLVQKTKIDFPLNKSCDVRIVAFPNYYYLYLHTLNSKSHLIWKIDGAGTVTSLSPIFQKLVDSSIKPYAGTLQLYNDNGKFYAIAHNYYDTIKSMASTILQLSEQFKVVVVENFLIPLERRRENLQQVSLNNNSLFVLKSVRDDDNGNSLDLLKIDLANGGLTTNSFNSWDGLYSYPRVAFCDRDSSIVIYSLLREQDIKQQVQVSVFISRLNKDLQMDVPVALIRNQFSENTLANFVYAAGATPLWLNMSINSRLRALDVNANQRRNLSSDTYLASPYRYFDYSFRSQPSAVRFTLLNKSFTNGKDSLVENNGKIIEIQPQPFGQFSSRDKAYLVLVQNFTAKRRGLVMITSDEKENFLIKNLPVFDRYEYVLSQLQSVNNKFFIVPYFYKNEMGLMKVTMNEN